MAQVDDSWSSNSNDVLTISLVTPSSNGLKQIASFNPKFTYPIFGDDERIFGYQDLRISLRYNANDMRPHVKIGYSRKSKAIGDMEPTNINEILEQVLPPVAFQKERDFETAVQRIPSDWTPPGQSLSFFDGKYGTYEIFKGSLADPAIKQIVSRIQIFSSLFIEGGTPIDLEDSDLHRWTVFLLYGKRPVAGESDRCSYVFAGYCTVYRFFLYQPPTPPASPSENGAYQPAVKDELDIGDGNFDLSALPCRSRISQFVILPPFQGKGNGPRLYNAIFQDYLKHPQTVEITVEDPNEAFDDLRDLADLQYLRSLPAFRDLRLNTSISISEDGMVPKNIVDPDACMTLRRQVKIAPRQFARVLEMHLMSQLPDPVRPCMSVEKPRSKSSRAQEHEYALWRLLVKTRVYRHNKDLLGQLDLAERIDKLDQTLDSVAFDYARLLNKLPATEEGSAPAGIASGKRKLEDTATSSSSKKVRIENA